MVLMKCVCVLLWTGSEAMAQSTESSDRREIFNPGRSPEVMIHGFRAPVTGIEFRQGMMGFYLGVYPTILGGEDYTTWYSKVGLSFYPLSFDLGRHDRKSNIYMGVSLLQGLSGERNVSVNVDQGTAFSGELGFRWAATTALDVRLGVIVLRTSEGEMFVNPTPGLSWSLSL